MEHSKILRVPFRQQFQRLISVWWLIRARCCRSERRAVLLFMFTTLPPGYATLVINYAVGARCLPRPLCTTLNHWPRVPRPRPVRSATCLVDGARRHVLTISATCPCASDRQRLPQPINHELHTVSQTNRTPVICSNNSNNYNAILIIFGRKKSSFNLHLLTFTMLRYVLKQGTSWGFSTDNQSRGRFTI